MLAIWRLDENAYGVNIRQQIAQVTVQAYNYGTMSSDLKQLFRKGYVMKSAGTPTPERGGRSKIFYRLSPEGITALEAARQLQRAIWKGVPEFSLDKA